MTDCEPSKEAVITTTGPSVSLGMRLVAESSVASVAEKPREWVVGKLNSLHISAHTSCCCIGYDPLSKTFTSTRITTVQDANSFRFFHSRHPFKANTTFLWTIHLRKRDRTWIRTGKNFASSNSAYHEALWFDGKGLFYLKRI